MNLAKQQTSMRGTGLVIGAPPLIYLSINISALSNINETALGSVSSPGNSAVSLNELEAKHSDISKLGAYKSE